MEQFLSISDPLILKFLKVLTQTVRQSRRSLFADDKLRSGLEIKTARLLYALSVLQFITNNTCNMPFHVPLTEAILCHRGTQKLVTFLNRIGAVVSVDTVNRIAVKVVKNKMEKGVGGYLVEGKVTIASIDNVDVLEPYAFACALDDTRSWHGTSVQCVQPLPESGSLTESDLHAQRVVCQSNVLPPDNTSNSPIPVLKKKRQKRTLTEHSPHTAMVASQPQSSKPLPLIELHLSEYASHTPPNMSLADFRPSVCEQESLDKLQEDIFQCLIHKLYRSKQSDMFFPGLQSFVNCVRKQCADREVSNVVYIEITSEKADSKQTLLGVISRLQTTFIKEQRQVCHCSWRWKNICHITGNKTRVSMSFTMANSLPW